MMTKKDYIRAAEIVTDMSLNYPSGHIVPKELIQAFTVFFTGDNPRFDAYRFQQACIPPNRKGKS